MSTTPPPKILTHYVCVSASTHHALRAFAAIHGVSEAHVAESWLNERIEADADLQWLAREFPKRMKELDTEFGARVQGRQARMEALP